MNCKKNQKKCEQKTSAWDLGRTFNEWFHSNLDAYFDVGGITLGLEPFREVIGLLIAVRAQMRIKRAVTVSMALVLVEFISNQCKLTTCMPFSGR